MDQDLERRLANLSSKLKPGEVRELEVGLMDIAGVDEAKVVARIYYKPTLEEELDRLAKEAIEPKVIPFQVTREGSNEVVASGMIDQENIQKIKREGKEFSVARSFVLKTKNAMLEKLNRPFVDDEGYIYRNINGVKTYYDEDGIPAYKDEHGNVYSKRIREGKEEDYLVLDDGTLLAFSHPDHIIGVSDTGVVYEYDPFDNSYVPKPNILTFPQDRGPSR